MSATERVRTVVCIGDGEVSRKDSDNFELHRCREFLGCDTKRMTVSVVLKRVATTTTARIREKLGQEQNSAMLLGLITSMGFSISGMSLNGRISGMIRHPCLMPRQARINAYLGYNKRQTHVGGLLSKRVRRCRSRRSHDSEYGVSGKDEEAQRWTSRTAYLHVTLA